MNSRSNNLLANIDWVSILLYLLLVLIGWINIYAAVYDENHSSILDISQKYGKQLIWIGAAFVLAFLVLLTDSKFFTTFSMVIYGIMIFLLIAVLFFGTETKGARSWFEVGDFRIQPAEFAKFATNLAIAYVMSRHNFKVMRFSSLLTIGLILALPAGLIILQNDTGSALVYSSFILVLFREGLHGSILLLCFVAAAIFIMALLYTPFTVLLVIIGGTLIAFYYYRHDIRELFQIILSIGCGFGLFALIKWMFNLSISDYYMLLIVYVITSITAIYPIYKRKMKNMITLLLISWLCVGAAPSVNYAFDHLQPHQQDRINELLGIKVDPKGTGYNVTQSKIAIGSGGLLGKGFLQGTQTIELRSGAKYRLYLLYCWRRVGICREYLRHRATGGVYFTNYQTGRTATFQFFPDIWLWSSLYPILPRGGQYWNDYWNGTSYRYSSSILQLRGIITMVFYHSYIYIFEIRCQSFTSL